MEHRNCCNPGCTKPVSARNRKFCPSCSPLASILWKREQRRLNRGTRYWLDHWLKVAGSEEAARAAYRAYMRQYMRLYRKSSCGRSMLSHNATNFQPSSRRGGRTPL